MTAPAPRPTLFLIAGPNGAGKTTFYETVLKQRVQAPFINADIIQRDELKTTSLKAAYKAAEIAEDRRRELIAAGQSFVTETVFSHPSKLAMLQRAREAGFRLVVFHLQLSSPDLSVARVEARVEEGGHAVPAQKVRERFERNQALIKAAVLLADRGAVYDASALNKPPRLLAQSTLGHLDIVAQNLPAWFERIYGGKS
ncbi:MAG TPA: zeta toxin family protein [Vitreimonas sp.]|uniref:zeta toxin family protein n=1 Tax=Vitreimonas sp. TaxID=3069702 RepID=UPI002D717B61|nr:zeta toxin family protein [Vitreimonas sp.]HYD89140.1 zeta toxin family protein [Vitreimonas sp.]